MRSNSIIGLRSSFVALAVIGAPAYSHAAENFHSGGTGRCGGCHDDQHQGQKNGWLLRASDPSSTCLRCHAGAGSPTRPSVFSHDGSAYTPGGDFFWMGRSYAWPGGSSPAETHGHNIVARDHGLVADSTPSAPGGTYPSSALGCTSCHDPHGKSDTDQPIAMSGSYGKQAPPGASVGPYRLLGGRGYNGGGVPGFSFTAAPPIAAQNPAVPFGESYRSHVDYGSGMSEWCRNCHPNRGTAIGTGHPAGNAITLTESIINNYNAYVRTGNMSGFETRAYLQFVPFERGLSDPTLLQPTSTQGPSMGANVMCLTCHRAHASAFPMAGRWDFTADLLKDSHPALGDAGISSYEVANSYYGRAMAVPFHPTQGQYCEKCHGAQ